MLQFIAPLLILAAFILLLIVSLSVPVIKTVFLFKLSANVRAGILDSVRGRGSVVFGVWGYCVSPVDVSVVGIGRTVAAECSDKKLGYTFDSDIADALNLDTSFADLISKSLTAVLVLHPIAAGLTFLTLLTSLFMLRRGSNGTSRFPSLLTLGVGVLAAILTTVVFLIDVILVAVVRNRVKDKTDGALSLNWGNAVWMALGATVALWLAMVGACAGICCGNRRTRKATTY